MKNRMINTKFWSDGWIINLDPLERYLFLYLLTNEHTNICGIYELPLKVIARESGIDEDMIEKMLNKLSDKILYSKGWVCVKNFLKHQKSSGSVKWGIENGLKLVPPEILAKFSFPLNTGEHSPLCPQDSLKSELEPELELKVPIGMDPPKETTNLIKTKEKKIKDLVHADTIAAIDYYKTTYQKCLGKEPFISSYGRYIKPMMKIIKIFGFDKTKEMLKNYFIPDKDLEDLLEKNKYDLQTFLSDFVINQLK